MAKSSDVIASHTSGAGGSMKSKWTRSSIPSFLSWMTTAPKLDLKKRKYPVRHKVHKNLEYHSVCPLVGIGPPYPSPASECVPPLNQTGGRGGTNSPVSEWGGGGGVPIRLVHTSEIIRKKHDLPFPQSFLSTHSKIYAPHLGQACDWNPPKNLRIGVLLHLVLVGLLRVQPEALARLRTSGPT